MNTTCRIRTWVRSPLHRFVTLVGLTAVATAGVALATPPSGEISRTELAEGRTSQPISIQRRGETTFHIHEVTVGPGAHSGWHNHPGAELSIVKEGEIVLVQAPDCVEVPVKKGEAMFIPQGTPHLARNDGTEPAQLYVTYTLPAGQPIRGDFDPAPCPER